MKNLRAIRERQGLTQAELAELIETDAAVISHYEAGTRGPAWTTAIRIADALGCSLDELAGRIEPTHVVAERNLALQRLSMARKLAQRIVSLAEKGATP